MRGVIAQVTLFFGINSVRIIDEANDKNPLKGLTPKFDDFPCALALLPRSHQHQPCH